MRLKPPVSADEAYRALSLGATLTWGTADAAAMEAHLRSIAAALAEVGALDIPDDVEPIFGEDGALDPEIVL